MTKWIVLALCLVACGSASPVEQSTEAGAAGAPGVELVCVTNATACTLSSDPYKNAGCWDLRTCNRAPLPGELTMQCQPVESASTLPRFFCTWSDAP